MPEENAKGKYGRFIQWGLNVLDLMLVNVLFAILCIINPEVDMTDARLKWLMVSVCYLPVILWISSSRKQRTAHIDRIATAALQAVGVHALFFISKQAFLRANDFSGMCYVEFYAMMLRALPMSWTISRLMVKRLRLHGRNYRRVVIVGTNPTARRLHDILTSDAGYGYRILGFFDDAPTAGFTGTYAGPLDTLEEYIRRHNVDEVFYTLVGEPESLLLSTVKITDDTMVDFHYVPNISPYVGRRFELNNVGDLPVLTPRVNPLTQPLNRLLKRSFDIAFSSMVLICSPIVFIPVAIAVKFSSPGPVFFRQKRTGYRGCEFNCLKFRTMRVNADADSRQATGNDPRKTKVGDFLRRTSIDELPQFINVLRGDMSIVGPRPHMLAHTEQYRELIDHYMIRHMVKPGITGWAQVTGFRGNTDELWKMQGRVDRDVWYIEHWSFMLDIKIIVKTVANAIHGEANAY